VAICDHLNTKEKQELLILLEKFKGLFDGNLCTWLGGELSIELKEGVKPYMLEPFIRVCN